MKVWDQAWIELAPPPPPGSAVRHTSVARHVSDCTSWPSERPYDQVHLDILYEANTKADTVSGQNINRYLIFAIKSHYQISFIFA